MSLASKGVLVTRFEGDATLNAMLARDSHTHAGGRPAIYGFARAKNPSDLPQLIVRQVDDRPDSVEELSGTVFHERWTIEAWARTTNDVHASILERVDALLHEQRFVSSLGADLKLIQKVGGSPDDYDGATDESFATSIYEVILAR